MDILTGILVIILSISLLANWILFLNVDLWKYKYNSSKKVYEEIIEGWQNVYKR